MMSRYCCTGAERADELDSQNRELRAELDRIEDQLAQGGQTIHHIGKTCVSTVHSELGLSLVLCSACLSVGWLR